MGAGASAAEGRVFCHHCGARTACPGELPRCGICGATDGVEATDQRLPTTGAARDPAGLAIGLSANASGAPTSAILTGATGSGATAATALAPMTAPRTGSMRVESVTVMAMQRPEDGGGLLLRVLPNVIARSAALPAASELEDPEASPQPACAAFVSRLRPQPLSAEAAAIRDVCVICADEMVEVGVPVVILACHHVFHESCIRRWLTRRHTCPTCRFELEIDNVKYLRSIGLLDEADALEKVEQETQARELQKQAAARRRWVHSMRRGDPVHFGLVCSNCADTPLIGHCYRCTVCEGFVLCGDCHAAQQANPADGHPEDHAFAQFGGADSGGASGSHGGVPREPGGQLTVLLPGPTRHAPHDEPPTGNTEDTREAEAPGEAALAAAEAAFVAVRSLAFAPLAGAAPPMLAGGGGRGAGAGGGAAAGLARSGNRRGL